MRRTILAGAAVLAVSSVALSACGSSSEPTAAPASSGAPAATTKLTAITVGSSPVLSNASLYYAQKNEDFAAAGLNVTPKVVTSGQEAVPLLLHGQIQFTAADPLGAIEAIESGLPFVIVGEGNIGPTDAAHDDTGLVVKAGGPTDAAQLSGKTIAVNAIGGLAQLAAEAAIDKLGGDSRDVKWVVLPIPSMIAAVQRGEVAGAVLAEPYVTQAKKAGLKDIIAPVSQGTPGVPQLVYVTTRSYLAGHAAVVREFATGLDRANATLAAHPSDVASIGTVSTTEPVTVLDSMILPVFSATPINLSILDFLQSVAIKYGVLKNQINLTSDVYSPNG
jgi:NitT/TauT family transport system substrate-binding protein